MSSKIKFVALLIVVISLLLNNVQSTREILSAEICGWNDPAVHCKTKEDCFEKCGGRPAKKVFCVRPGDHSYDRLCCCRA
ncbi:hypothetical protein ISN44_As05g055810 [Arabidopsis suecica]|uniref:Uncharacterized protein n=1 Tax=Arabidopsis suecica TaxID=45249 RepID=A0A8T2DQ59_ARASU|nr:hypothetical protein ISN44_As05g055810 [Arabidopsis suecica]